MNVLELPDHIFPDRKQLDSEIIFHHFTVNKNTVKEKSILKRNAFSLVINGSKTMYFAEKTVNILDSEIHLLSAGSCLASIELSKNKPFESLLIFFDNDVLNDFLSRHSNLILKLQDKKEQLQSYLEFQKDEFIKHFIQSALQTFQNNQQPSEAMKQLKLQELFLYLLENHSAKFLSFKYDNTISELELKIRKVVETNIENNLTTKELAFLCNVSVSSFKRHFKNIYHTSPIKWHNEQRMKRATKMLVNERPSEIWHKLGFETHTGFSKSFKKYHGMSPMDFMMKK